MQWCRFYDTFHPLVGNAMDLHTQMPLSRFVLKGIKDKKVLRFFEQTLEQMDAFMLMYSQLREYWLIGENFTYLNWDEDMGTFTDGELLMPEYIEVRGHPFVRGETEGSYAYFLIPDEGIRAFINSPDESCQELKGKVPMEIRQAVEEEKNIRISNFNLMVLMRKQARYNPRGTSIILRCLKDLLYEDKLREAQYAIADRHVLPKEIWKIGNEKFLPNKTKMKAFRNLIRDAEDQPKFTLVTHYAVNYEIQGATGKFPQLTTEFEWVENRILTALFTNKALTHGEGPTYANASIATRAMMMRYIPVRSQLEDVWKSKVFLPIAIEHGFYKTTEAELSHRVRTRKSERELTIPEFDWRWKSNLLDDQNVRDMIKGMVAEGQLPMKTLIDMLGMDYDSILEWRKREEGTVFDPLYAELRKAAQKEGMDVTKGASISKSAINRRLTEMRNATKQLTKTESKIDKPREFDFLSRGGLTRKIKSASMLLHKGEADVVKFLLGTGKDNVITLISKTNEEDAKKYMENMKRDRKDSL